MSNKQFNFIIELCPPLNTTDIPDYYEKIKYFIDRTDSFSIASHPRGIISGFDKSYNLARYLLNKQSHLEIIFHLTCKDLNRVNIYSRLSSLRFLRIKRLLIITGQDYAIPEIHPQVHFDNSTQLAEFITKEFADWFEHISIAGYPGGHPNYSHSNLDECTRLIQKSSIVKPNFIQTQCIFDVSVFREFKDILSDKIDKNIEVIPSLGLFNDLKSLNRCSKLIRVGMDEKLIDILKSLDPTSCKQFIIDYFVTMCEKLNAIQNGITISLCVFGQYDLAREIIEKLT